MPKPRAKLSAVEESIISKGGEPGNAALVEPARIEPARTKPVKAAPPPDDPEGDEDGKEPLYRHAMIRFKPKDFDDIKKAANRQGEELSMRISLNAWVISACREKLKRDSE